MIIDIKTIPHKKQRYDTVGDYFTDKKGCIHFRVSEMSDPRYAWLVLIHELIEKALCLDKGIKDSEIDAFDEGWKAHDGIEEPGSDPWAPYYKQHMLAMDIEKKLADVMDVNWEAYDAEVMGLKWR